MRETLIQRIDSQQAMQVMMLPYLSSGIALYDVGCGEKPFGPFLKDKVAKHIGVDVNYGFYDVSHIDLIGSADDLPIEDGAADAILSSQVIEHLPDPEKSIAESARVLKPGGLLFLSYPYLYPIHAPPFDYARLSQFALDAMLERHGFDLLERRVLGGFWYMLGALMPIYLQGLPLLRSTGLHKPISALTRFFFKALHALEGMALKAIKGDTTSARSTWPVCYVLVARRRETA